MHSHTAVSVADIPNIDAPPEYTILPDEIASPPRIRLPSGHIAMHLKRYADVKAILAAPGVSRKLCNEENGPSFHPGAMPKELLINLDMPEHGKSRRIAAKDFTSSGIEPLRGLLEATVSRALDEMIDGRRPPDLFSSVLHDVTSTAICRTLGIPLADRDLIQQWGKTVQVAAADDLPTLGGAIYGLSAYLMDFVQGRRCSEPDGFIERYLDARSEAESPLSDEEVIGVLATLLVAGDQNGLTVLTKCVYVLLCAQPLWHRLTAEHNLIPAMIEELIRLIPIGKISTLPRVATENIQTSVGMVPAGMPFSADVFLANRDPEVYADPLTINPDRPAKPHLQFGHGIHSCMGTALARMEISIVLGELVRRLPAMRLSIEPEALTWTSGTVLRRPDALPIVLSRSAL
jgi:cytochrome P450